jgi:putative endonuclease
LSLGREGESLAARHLEAQGLRIVARNWRGRSGEIDLVCEEGTRLVFVEVKTRSSRRFGFPEEAIGPRKLERMRRTAYEYLLKRFGEERPCQLDVVAVEPGPDGRLVARRLAGLA